MKFFRTLSALTAISAVFLVPSAWSATDEQHDSQHPAATPTVQVAQAQPGMEPQMKIMQSGMSMMGDMGSGAMMAKPDDMAARQGMMEQRMGMMHVNDADDGPHTVGSGDEVRGRS